MPAFAFLPQAKIGKFGIMRSWIAGGTGQHSSKEASS